MSARISIEILDTTALVNSKSASADICIAGSTIGGFAGQMVTVTLNGKVYTSSIASDGLWTVRIGLVDLAALIAGDSYTLMASVTDNSGSIVSASVSVTIDAHGHYVPPRNEDEARLTRIWQMVFGLSRIGVKDDFFKLGGQRVIAARLASEVEKTFGTKIDVSTLLLAPTIERLALRLKQSPDISDIVPLRTSGDKMPLFCFHGGGGHLLEYREMANMMPDDQPVYGVRAPDLDGAQELMSVEELAERYACKICEVQESGPYHLCGLSFGGLLAYAVATKFAGEGEKIGLLALFDTGNPAYYRNLSLSRSLRFVIDTIVVRSTKYVQSLMHGDIAAIAKFVREFFARKLNAFRWKASRRLSRAAGRPMPKVVRDNVRMFGTVAKAYSPKRFSGKLTLFRAADGSPEYRLDPALGWDVVVAGDVEVRMVRGGHLTMMEKPNVADLVGQLSHLLSRGNGLQQRASLD